MIFAPLLWISVFSILASVQGVDPCAHTESSLPVDPRCSSVAILDSESRGQSRDNSSSTSRGTTIAINIVVTLIILLIILPVLIRSVRRSRRQLSIPSNTPIKSTAYFRSSQTPFNGPPPAWSEIETHMSGNEGVLHYPPPMYSNV
ncbi:hypothetical protein FIBSPDRAFT_296332 [Athelia psychrophila]|uniref:Mid2 domain-containing protein n=1 Tax=Athelia psychrophila TaxID=1759441 RepID=A0A167XA20_9AGAM|nr:hypothetical protein FIBSPDRAFT_296332 [Fibularhizoctonia sp. CBS 109695]